MPVLWPIDIADAPVPKAGQMPHRQGGAVMIVKYDRVLDRAAEEAVYEEMWFLRLREGFVRGPVEIFHEDNAVHRPAEQAFDRRALEVWVPVRVHNHAREALLDQRVLDTADDRRDERTHNVVD